MDSFQKNVDNAKAELFSVWFEYNNLYALLVREKETGGKLGRIDALQKECDILLEKYNAIQRFLRD